MKIVVKLIALFVFVWLLYAFILKPKETKDFFVTRYNIITNLFDKNENEIITIPLEKDDSGLYYITVKLNDVPLRFLLDTGCSTMQIRLNDAEFLFHHKIVAEDDINGTVQTSIANGDTEENVNITINKVELNGIVANDLNCLVANTIDAPLLIGQEFLSKLGKITIDYRNNLLIINKK